MASKQLTMPYVVWFATMSLPDPRRIGTSEELMAPATVWATDADEAISEVKRLCAEANREYLRTISAEVPTTGIAREIILNDEKCTVSMKDLEAGYDTDTAGGKHRKK